MEENSKRISRLASRKNNIWNKALENGKNVSKRAKARGIINPIRKFLSSFHLIENFPRTSVAKKKSNFHDNVLMIARRLQETKFHCFKQVISFRPQNRRLDKETIIVLETLPPGSLTGSESIELSVEDNGLNNKHAASKSISDFANQIDELSKLEKQSAKTAKALAKITHSITKSIKKSRLFNIYSIDSS